MKRVPYLLGATGLALALGTVSCTTLGTHVKGGFACKAPVGTCAPMSHIDAQAIAGLGALGAQAMPIANDGMDGQARFITTGAEGVPVRTGERVMRVVFPAHTDGRGVFHDEAVAHVVSGQSGWTLRRVDAPTAGSLDAAIAAASPSASGTASATTSPGPVTSAVPLNLREAAAGLSAPADPLPDAPHEQVAVDMPAGSDDLPSPQALAAAHAGHRIRDAVPEHASSAQSSAKAGLQWAALHAHHHKPSGHAVAATVPGAATAALNRAVLRKLGSAGPHDTTAASPQAVASLASAGGLPR